MYGYRLTEVKGNTITIEYNKFRSARCEWSNEFTLSNALNLGFLSQFVYQDKVFFTECLNNIHNNAVRSFNFT